MKLTKYSTGEIKSINKFQPMVSPDQLQRSKTVQLFPNFRFNILLSIYLLNVCCLTLLKARRGQWENKEEARHFM